MNPPLLVQASKKQKLVQGLAVAVLGPFCFWNEKLLLNHYTRQPLARNCNVCFLFKRDAIAPE